MSPKIPHWVLHGMNPIVANPSKIENNGIIEKTNIDIVQDQAHINGEEIHH